MAGQLYRPEALGENSFKSRCIRDRVEKLRLSSLIPVISQLGLGAIGGFAVGFALKKLAKLALFLLGIFIIALLFLAKDSVISINYEALWAWLANMLAVATQALSSVFGAISVLPFIGSLGLGFLLGLKVG
jgi:uncharacterized membrane protein (Fun14 family)